MNDRERTARHEAGHAAAAVLLAVPIRIVSLVPDATSNGRVTTMGGIDSPEMAVKHMIVGLCGQLEDAETWDEVPSWPLYSHHSPDEAILAEMAELLGLDKAGWDRVFHLALEFSLSDQYERLVSVITGTLEHVPQFGPELIEQVHACVKERPR
jgi:hypothetical protein